MTQKEIDHLLNWLAQHDLQQPSLTEIAWWVELRTWAISHGYEPQKEETNHE